MFTQLLKLFDQCGWNIVHLPWRVVDTLSISILLPFSIQIYRFIWICMLYLYCFIDIFTGRSWCVWQCGVGQVVLRSWHATCQTRVRAKSFLILRETRLCTILCLKNLIQVEINPVDLQNNIIGHWRVWLLKEIEITRKECLSKWERLDREWKLVKALQFENGKGLIASSLNYKTMVLRN